MTNLIPFSPFEVANDPRQIGFFLLVDLLLTLPFAAAGFTVALILRTWPKYAGGLYAWDLVGASIGVLLLFVSLPLVGAPGAVALSSALGFAAATAFAAGRTRSVWAVAALACVATAFTPGLLPDVRVDSSKPLIVETEQRGGEITFTGWNALSRIDVVERDGVDPMILIDSAAMTYIAPPGDDSPHRRNISTLAPRLLENPSVVIIGSGGGMDVQNALAFGAREVRCVEINPIIIDLVTNRYRDAVGGIFSHPRVQLVRDEGRSYIARMDGNVDLIQVTLIDTWAAGASGAYSLSENYLYTVDAFEDYLSRLTPSGMISFTRWYYETPRLVTVAREALERVGVTRPEKHVCVVQQKISTAFLVKRSPFTDADMAGIYRIVSDLPDTEVLYDPTRSGDPEGATNFFQQYLTAPDTQPLLDAFPVAIHPVTDDDPFFFQMARWSDLDFRALRSYTSQNFLEPLSLPAGQLALATALGLGILLSGILLTIPLAAGRVPREQRFGWLGYFFALGLAFIVVEVVLIQRFALFLGHPTYSVTMVLFAILLFSGLGSAFSARRSGAAARVVTPVLGGLVAMLLVFTFAVPPITDALIGLPLIARILLAVVFIGPVAFLMGMPFPLGIRTAGGSDAGHVAWAWAANGCASVVGSVGAVMGAMTWGFSAMLVVAAAIYAAALLGFSRSGLSVPR
jgi:hypothetical protein